MAYRHPDRLFHVTSETLEELEINEAKYLEQVDQILEDNEAELKKAEEDERASNFTLEVEIPIDRKKQLDITQKLNENQIQFKINKLKKRYDASSKDWKNSGDSRPRLVIIEAHEGINLEELANRILNASPIERLLIVDLNNEQKAELERNLKIQWKNKYSHSDDIKVHVKEILSKQNPEETILDDEELDLMIDRLKIDDLIGPHFFQRDLSIDKATLAKRHPQFDTNIEDIIAYGNDDDIAKNVLALGNSINNGLRPSTFRSRPFEEDYNGAYMFAGNYDGSLLELITSGKSATELLSSKSDGEKLDVSIAPQYESLFTLNGVKSEMNRQGLEFENLEKNDLDYLKKILLDDALYKPLVSPKAYNTTVSAATSLVQIKKSEAVEKTIWRNIVDIFASTAKELKFSIISMCRDGGTDQIQEDIRKTNNYKSLFQNTVQKLREKGLEEDEVIKIAFAQTADAYTSIEKFNSNIYEIENSEAGAEACRNYGIIYTDKVEKYNRKALKILNVAPVIFLVSMGAIIGGLLTFLPALATGTIAVASSSLGLDIGRRVVSYLSIRFQKKANAKALTKADISLSLANALKNRAQDERDKLIAKRKDELNAKISTLNPQQINYETLGCLERTSETLLEYPEIATKEVTKRSFRSFFLKRTYTVEIPPEELKNQVSEEGEKIIEEVIDLILNQNVGGDGKLPEGTVSKELVRGHVKEIFSSVANRQIVAEAEEYKNNLQKLLNSDSSRSRLVIIEAPKEHTNQEMLAKTIFNSSPQERILVVGAKSSQKDEMMFHMKKMFAKRLKDSSEDKSFIADKTAPILLSMIEKAKDWESLCKEHPFLRFKDNDKLKEFINNNVRLTAENKYQNFNDEERKKFIEDFVEMCNEEDSSSLFLTNLMPHEELLRPHIFQEDLNINVDTLKTRYPQFEVNIEEILLLGEEESLAEDVSKLGLEIDGGIPTFSIKADPFPPGYQGQYQCACKNLKKVMDAIASAKSAHEILGVKQDQQTGHVELSNMTQASNSGAITTDNFENVTISPVYKKSFNLDAIRIALPENAENISKKDLEYLLSILFKESLYDANMSPKKSGITISKSNGKLGSLAGLHISISLDSSILGKPQNLVEEIDYAIAAMALDTGVDYENENLIFANLYRSFFTDLMQHNIDNGESKTIAIEKALTETINFISTVRNDKALAEERIKGTVSRKLAYEMVNEAKHINDKSKKNLRPLILLSFLSLGLGATAIVLSLVTFGAALPIAIGLAAVASAITAGKFTFLGLALKKVRKTNKHIITRSNRLSKNASLTFKNLYEKVNSKKGEALSEIKKQWSIQQRRNNDKVMEEMIKMKQEVKNIMRGLIANNEQDKVSILSKILLKVKLKDWQKNLYIDEIRKSDLDPKDKKRFLEVLTPQNLYAGYHPRIQRGIRL